MCNNDTSYQLPFLIRPVAILTTNFESGLVMDHVHLQNQLILYIDLTIGSLDSAEILVETADDNIDFYKLTINSIDGNTISPIVAEYGFIDTEKYRIQIPIKDKYILVSAKGTGDPSGSLMKITGIVGST